MDSNKNFYLSALIAFGSYLFLIFLFLIYLTTSEVKKFDAISKDTVLELEVVISKHKKVEKKVQKKVEKPPKKEIKELKHLKEKTVQQDKEISKKVVKKSKSTSAKQRSDLKSLFANVKTKANVVKKKQVNKVKKSSVASRFKAKFEKQTKSDTKITKFKKQTKSNNLEVSKLFDKMIEQEEKKVKKRASQTKNENDLYWSKIYEILDSRYNQLLLIDGLSAKAIITIDLNGKFSYRFIKFSGDKAFDNQLKLFLERQRNEYFPPPKDSKKTIEITFASKGS